MLATDCSSLDANALSEESAAAFVVSAAAIEEAPARSVGIAVMPAPERAESAAEGISVRGFWASVRGRNARMVVVVKRILVVWWMFWWCSGCYLFVRRLLVGFWDVVVDLMRLCGL